jgi:soluble lytic murein transglycosylase-like protein
MRNGLMGSKRAAAGQPLADDAGTMRVPVGEVPDGLWKAQLGQESGGKQFGKDGKPLTSSAGAVGIAQVMPGTGPEAAKLAGLPWDVRRYHQDAGYNEALGKAYMAKQLQTFGGDV